MHDLDRLTPEELPLFRDAVRKADADVDALIRTARAFNDAEDEEHALIAITAAVLAQVRVADIDDVGKFIARMAQRMAEL